MTFGAVVILIAAAVIGFFIGSGMDQPMGGACLFTLIAGFACTIWAIERGKKQ